MNFKVLSVLALFLLTFQTGMSQELLPTNSENFARIFSEKEVYLKVTSYGGITGGKIGESTFKIERDQECCTFLSNINNQNLKSQLIGLGDFAALQDNLLNLMKFHGENKIPAGNCVYFDKNFEIYSSAGKMFIKPLNASAQISNFNNWFQLVNSVI